MTTTTPILPPAPPRLSASALLKMIEPYKVDLEKYKLIVVAIRGYYKNSMGVVGTNDRGIYDDAIFLYSKDAMIAYNANTDPAVFRKGAGFGDKKGMAILKGNAVYYAHQFGLHKNKHEALVQRLGTVTVLRDSLNSFLPYEDTGNFGINIHAGGNRNTFSEGCLTLPPLQFASFIGNVKDLLQRYYANNWKKNVVPLVLIDN